jgi:excinuclease UvrABC nuclease subunit
MKNLASKLEFEEAGKVKELLLSVASLKEEQIIN